jgi:hypothetical protein
MVKRYFMSDLRQTERCDDRDVGFDHDAPGSTVYAATTIGIRSNRDALRQKQRASEN